MIELLKTLFIIPYEYFGYGAENFGEKEVKKNAHIYRRYAIGSFPGYWFNIEVTEEWNDIIKKFCNDLPKKAKDLSKWQKVKLRWHYFRLMLKDSALSIKNENTNIQ